MKHIVCFSGGKDSTALVLWAKENLPEFTAVFCDTGWEHPITYAYVEEINQAVLGGKLVRLKSDAYPGGFVQVCIERKMFPNGFARFCTSELKIAPLHRYYQSQNDGDLYVYLGIRADESAARSCMSETEYVGDGGGYYIKRPLLRWTSKHVFEYAKARGVKPNPLYLMDLSRVGCFPCIQANLRDIKAYLASTPEIKPRLMQLEASMRERTGEKDRTFFRSGFIPDRFCSVSTLTQCRACNGHGTVPEDNPKEVCSKCHGNGQKRVYVPTVEDVFRYIESVDENQLPLLPARTCMSVYNLCE